jgi:hypothetical protein
VGLGEERGVASALGARPPHGGGAPPAVAAAVEPVWAGGLAAAEGKRGGASTPVAGHLGGASSWPKHGVPAMPAAGHHGGAGSRPGSSGLDPTFQPPMVVLVGGGRCFPLLRRCLRHASRRWCGHFVVAICVVRGTLGSTAGQEKSLLLLATATPVGAVFLLGGVVVSDCSSPHRAPGETLDPGLGRAAAASRCRSLLEGVALVAHVVPRTADGVDVGHLLRA